MAFSSATKAGLMRLSQAQNPSTGNNSVMLSKRKIGGLGKIQAAANVGETESKPGHKISHSAAGLLSRREFIPGKGRESTSSAKPIGAFSSWGAHTDDVDAWFEDEGAAVQSPGLTSKSSADAPNIRKKKAWSMQIGSKAMKGVGSAASVPSFMDMVPITEHVGDQEVDES